jgi:hypothetical protein
MPTLDTGFTSWEGMEPTIVDAIRSRREAFKIEFSKFKEHMRGPDMLKNLENPMYSKNSKTFKIKRDNPKCQMINRRSETETLKLRTLNSKK